MPIWGVCLFWGRCGCGIYIRIAPYVLVPKEGPISKVSSRVKRSCNALFQILFLTRTQALKLVAFKPNKDLGACVAETLEEEATWCIADRHRALVAHSRRRGIQGLYPCIFLPKDWTNSVHQPSHMWFALGFRAVFLCSFLVLGVSMWFLGSSLICTLKLPLGFMWPPRMFPWGYGSQSQGQASGCLGGCQMEGWNMP